MCSRDGWNVGTSHQLGTDEYILTPFRCIYQDNGPTIHVDGDLYGYVAHSSDEAWRLLDEHGYTIPCGRNNLGFVQSRAARKRGLPAREAWYDRKTEDYRLREWDVSYPGRPHVRVMAHHRHHAMKLACHRLWQEGCTAPDDFWSPLDVIDVELRRAVRSF